MTNEEIFRELVSTTSITTDIDELILQLKALNYFISPASLKYHLSEKGGLFEHSKNVAISLLELTVHNDLKWQNNDSPLLIGLFHDICKCDQYIYDDLNRKYVWNDHQQQRGHGDKSITILDRLSKQSVIRPITDEERLCIRWHMGAFDEKQMWELYTNAIHKFPNVLWTHMADMIASHIKEL